MSVGIKFNSKQMMITNATAYWIKVFAPEQKYKAEKGVMEYSLQVLVPEEVVDALADNEVNKKPSTVKDKNKATIKNAKKAGKEPILYPEQYEDLYVLTLASLAKWPDGKDKAIKVAMNGKIFNGMAGNETVVDVICELGKDYGDGRPAYLSEVNIKDLVEVDASKAPDPDAFGFEADNEDFGEDFESDDVPF